MANQDDVSHDSIDPDLENELMHHLIEFLAPCKHGDEPGKDDDEI